MMSAIIAAKDAKNNVTIIEKTSSLGNKLKITGKGRCNLTFNGDIEDFKKNVVHNSKFMYSSFTNFDNQAVVKFFSNLGVNTKVERGARIFPVSDKAQDVVNALKKKLKDLHVKVIFNDGVKEIVTKNDSVVAVKTFSNKEIKCDKCIIATGGKSYQSTGSTGDGYSLAKKLGHKIIDIKPGLVPLRSNDNICKALQGLSLRNVKLRLMDSDKIIYEDFGELLFAHFGLTGPVILSSSSKLNRIDNIEEKLKEKKIYAVIDLKSALDNGTLDKRICRDFEKYANKEFKNSLDDLLPQKLIPEIIRLSKIEETKKVHQITKVERQNLLNIIKNLKINISGFMPLDYAIITCGGVDVKEVNPKTMESKLVNGLYFAGEVLDVDAYTGGYNLQIAFSTAVLAGKS